LHNKKRQRLHRPRDRRKTPAFPNNQFTKIGLTRFLSIDLTPRQSPERIFAFAFSREQVSCRCHSPA
jgi:hypothetical protein